MATAINLLPAELVPKGILTRVGNTLSSLVIAGFVVFFVFGLGEIALIIINSFQIGNLTNRQNQLRENIKSLEQTEQRLILVSDRVDKAKIIYEGESVGKAIDNLFKLILSFPGGVTLSAVETDSKKTSLSINSTDSTPLAQFMSGLVSGNFFENIRLSSFTFNPSTGYLVTFDVSNQ